MRLLNPEFNLDQFFIALSDASQSVLFLDYDGTLAPFTPDRDKAVPYGGVRTRLNRLLDLSRTRLVMVTGRTSAELVPLLALKATPEIWGLHGGERRLPDGGLHLPKLSENVTRGLLEADTWAAKNELNGLLESKAISRAFHWRGLSGMETANLKIRIVDHWAGRAAKYGLTLEEFDGGLELRAADITKGGAVRQLMSETDTGAVVAYLGDDRTDEDAFAALGKNGTKVLVRCEYRPTLADLWLEPPDELNNFLDRWIQSVESSE